MVNLAPGLSEETGWVLTLALGGATCLVSLLAWRGDWEPASPRFARQMLAVTMATLVAAPHSHFHGTVLLLAPLALVVARPAGGSTLDWAWKPLLAVGYLLSLVAWLLRALSWLYVPYFLLVMGLLIYQDGVLQRRPVLDAG